MSSSVKTKIKPKRAKRTFATKEESKEAFIQYHKDYRRINRVERNLKQKMYMRKKRGWSNHPFRQRNKECVVTELVV